MGISLFSGRFCVGSRDFQWAAHGLSTVFEASEINPDKHLVGRLFYPTSKVEGIRPVSTWLSSCHEAAGFASFLFFTASTWKKWILQPLFRVGIWIFGNRTHVPICENAAIAETSDGNGYAGADLSKFPVIVFSHGVGGTRSTYSLLCAEVASQGFVVLAVEHTDGSASCVHCAGQGGWRNYSGLGNKEVQYRKLAWRMREVATAGRFLESLHKGTLSSEHCQLGGLVAASSFLRGRLNLKELALVGHSFGGATVTAAAAVDMAPRAVVALDPWWPAVPPQSPALGRWQTHTPLLVIGSDAWNTPYNDKGDIVCGRQLQTQILAAAHHEKEAGGGAVLLVVKNSSHDSFSDLPVLFAHLAWLLAKLGFVTKLGPKLGLAAVSSATSQFLHRHLQTPQAPQLPQLISARLSGIKAGDCLGQGGPELPPADGRGGSEWVVVSENAASQKSVENGAPQGSVAVEGTNSSGNQVDGQRGDNAMLGVASEATRAMSGSFPGRALDPSAGGEPLAVEQGGKVWKPLKDDSNVAVVKNDSAKLLSQGEQSTKGDFGSVSPEADKVAVCGDDEVDIRNLLGDLALVLQLHI